MTQSDSSLIRAILYLIGLTVQYHLSALKLYVVRIGRFLCLGFTDPMLVVSGVACDLYYYTSPTSRRSPLRDQLVSLKIVEKILATWPMTRSQSPQHQLHCVAWWVTPVAMVIASHALSLSTWNTALSSQVPVRPQAAQCSSLDVISAQLSTSVCRQHQPDDVVSVCQQVSLLRTDLFVSGPRYFFIPVNV